MARAAPWHGEVVSIHIAPKAEDPMRSVRTVRAIAGRGLEGDRYFRASGTYSDRPGPAREITLIESEAIAAMALDNDLAISPGRCASECRHARSAPEPSRRPGIPRGGRPAPWHPTVRAVLPSGGTDATGRARRVDPPRRTSRPDPHRRRDPGRQSDRSRGCVRSSGRGSADERRRALTGEIGAASEVPFRHRAHP